MFYAQILEERNRPLRQLEERLLRTADMCLHEDQFLDAAQDQEASIPDLMNSFFKYKWKRCVQKIENRIMEIKGDEAPNEEKSAVEDHIMDVLFSESLRQKVKYKGSDLLLKAASRQFEVIDHERQKIEEAKQRCMPL